MSDSLSLAKVKSILNRGKQTPILVLGDFMLDRFISGKVNRISPEAPVPVVEFEKENTMPGGAANVARNLTSMHVAVSVAGVIGRDEAGKELKKLLTESGADCSQMILSPRRFTSIKTRIVAQKQQLVRIDREQPGDLDRREVREILKRVLPILDHVKAVILGDYCKGGVTQPLLEGLLPLCHERGIHISLDPKPGHRLDLRGVSLITPNRKEAFELAGYPDSRKTSDPMKDQALLDVVEKLSRDIAPEILLITLGEAGMLLCQKGHPPHLIPTVARDVFDVSGAGDTVIASFTLAICSGASPLEAAIFANHAAGVVVAKMGTATVSPKELLDSFKQIS